MSLKQEIQAFRETVQMFTSDERLHAKIEDAAEQIIKTLRSGGKILIAGNGGSAADAQHFAAEIVGRYKIDRKGFPAVALSTDTSILTAIANDFGYESVFARQVEALGVMGDLFIGISTSGNSKNILNAIEVAQKKGLPSIALTGKGGGELAKHTAHLLDVDSTDTPRIQEIHGFIIHALCESVDKEL